MIGKLVAPSEPGTEYLPGQSAALYRARLVREHPWVDGLIDDERFANSLVELDQYSNEFDIDSCNGRGVSYRNAMHLAGVRAEGMLTLLRLAGAEAEEALVLDVLGGNGELARVALSAGLPAGIVTSDAARFMVSAALDSGRAAIRQFSSDLVLRDSTLDGVVIAYGTHHISPGDLPRTVAEAHRVLRPGGRLVIHDFEPAGAMSRWFREVVEPHAPGGHDYYHLGAKEIRHLFDGCGWRDVKMAKIQDPFKICGSSSASATNTLLNYLRCMYGIPLSGGPGLGDDELLAHIERIFASESDCGRQGIAVKARDDGMYAAKLNRWASVGVARK